MSMRDHTTKILEEAYDQILAKEISIDTAVRARKQATAQGRTAQAARLQGYVNTKKSATLPEIGQVILHNDPVSKNSIQSTIVDFVPGDWKTGYIILQSPKGGRQAVYDGGSGKVMITPPGGAENRFQQQRSQYDVAPVPLQTDRAGRMIIVKALKGAGVNVNVNSVGLLGDFSE